MKEHVLPNSQQGIEHRNPLEALMGYQMRRTSYGIEADLAARLDDFSLSAAAVALLLFIEANPGASQSDIGRKLVMKSGNVTPITAQLFHRGLIARSQARGRSHGLNLTPEGEAICIKVRERVEANEAHFLAVLEEREYYALMTILAKLRAVGCTAEKIPATRRSVTKSRQTSVDRHREETSCSIVEM